MKLFYTALLTALTIFSGVALAQDDQGLPNPGGNEPAPVEAAPAQSTKEFNSDIDDFEKKVDKEVPGANKGKEPKSAMESDRASAKAKQQIKDQMTKGDPDNGGKARSAVPTRSARAAVAASSKKKTSAAAKKKAAAAKKKKAAAKKKKKKGT